MAPACLVLVLAVVAVLAIASDPSWKMYAWTLVSGSSDLPLSFYQPRELVAGGNAAPAPRVAPQLESLDPRALEQAAGYAAEHDSRALIVTRHGHIVFERYWHATGFDTLEDSQSLAPVLSALLAGIAIGDHRIGWPDEPVGNFLEQWRNDPRGAITVRNLMQSSSGLAPASGRARFATGLAAARLRQPLSGRPGESWAEQPADAQLLAMIIEHATGQRYGQYLSGALWRRIGAADAWLWLDQAGGLAHADCCFIARQGDWIRVGELLVNNGRYQGDEIVPPGWVGQMLRPAKGNAAYGSYVRVAAAQGAVEPYAARDVFLVEGSGHRLWLVPSMQLVVLRTGPALRAGSGWDDSRIPNLVIRGARDYVPARAQPGADLSTLVPNH
jgi:CubicO group peptidase (beta-lactamase class C family)